MKGKFITFEGSEGCGKSTQSKLLDKYLRSRGYATVYLREPGGTKVSEKIRKLLLDTKNDSMIPECELFLYMAARAQVVSEVIRPALRQGKIVICDRFLDSTLAYQGYGLGMDLGFIKILGKFAAFCVSPDLTIFLDLTAEQGLKRAGKVKDRIERRALSYHRRVRRGYFALAKAYPRRIKIIKADDAKTAIQDRIRKEVCRLKI